MELKLIKGGKEDRRTFCTSCKRNTTIGDKIRCSVCSEKVCTSCDVSTHPNVVWCKNCANDCDSRK